MLNVLNHLLHYRRKCGFNTHRTIQSGDEKAWGGNVLSGIDVLMRQLPFSRFYNFMK